MLIIKSAKRRLLDKIEIHYTPKHGSWLNVAEIELSALTLQCLNRRIPDEATLRTEICSWRSDRNQAQKSVDWRFTTADARIKLKALYPQIGGLQSTKVYPFICHLNMRSPGLHAHEYWMETLSRDFFRGYFWRQ